ncbi:MAG: hypothetical protein WBF53_02680 [Litorimonas sp.]
MTPFRSTLLGSVVVLLAACVPSADTDVSDLAVAAQIAPAPLVITEDIARFWEAYDRIRETDDPREQLFLLNSLYIDPGTPGLHAMNRARGYRTVEYLQAINDYPEFWAAVREPTLRADDYGTDIETGLRKVRDLYASDQPVPIYFVIGALRTAGTAADGKMLIGAELAMSDSATPTHELTERLGHLADYVATDPIQGLVDLNLHEYIHAVQHSVGGNDLLSYTLFEGSAEYLSTEAIGRPSAQPAITYGLANRDAVLDAFEADIGLTDISGWIWNSADNAFGQRDLGYFVGYVVTQAYLERATDREAAIATLIEMDYTDPDAVARVVDASGVFEEPVATIRTRNGHPEPE